MGISRYFLIKRQYVLLRVAKSSVLQDKAVTEKHVARDIRIITPLKTAHIFLTIEFSNYSNPL